MTLVLLLLLFEGSFLRVKGDKIEIEDKKKKFLFPRKPINLEINPFFLSTDEIGVF